jgi:hypothetical protein
VVWFGGILRPHQHERLIQVGLENEGAQRSKSSRVIATGVGALPLLPLGSRWRRQKRIEDPFSTNTQFREFTVELNTAQPQTITHVGTVHTVPGRNRQDLRIYPISQMQYKFGGLFGLASETLLLECTAVLRGSPITIVVPMPVLVQFYWGSSTSLAREAFEDTWVSDPPEFAHVMDLERSAFDATQRLARIALRPRFLITDAALIARAWFDAHARTAVRSIAASISAYEANQISSAAPPKPFYGLKTGFPFLGPTTLRVYGNLHSRGARGKRLLVLRILGCTHPFPFERVEVIGRKERTGSGAIVAVGGSPVLEHPTHKVRRQRQIARPVQAVTDEPAQNGVVGLQIEELLERFDDLQGKIQQRRRDATSAAETQIVHRAVKSGPQFSLGGAQWGAPLPPLDAGFAEIVVPTPPPPSANDQPPREIDPFRDDFPFLLDVVHRLAAATVTVQRGELFQFQTSFEPVVALRHGLDFMVDQEARPVSYFPKPLLFTDSVSQWLHTDVERTIRRLCMVIQVQLVDKFFYVFEMTRQRHEKQQYYPRLFMWDPKFKRFSDDDIDEVLTEAVNRHLERVWLNESSLRDLRRSFFKHNTFNPHVCAATILRLALKDACGLKPQHEYRVSVPKEKQKDEPN